MELKKYIAVVCCVVLCIACNDQEVQQALSYGKVSFTVAVNQDMDIDDPEEIEEQPDLSGYNVHLYNQGIVPGFPRPFQGKYSQLPDEFTLPATDGYVIDMESCTYEEAVTANDGWGQRRIAGSSGVFEVRELEEHLIKFECTIANVAVTIGYSPLFPERFVAYQVKVFTVLSEEEDEEGNLIQEKRELVYDEEASLSAPVGYFNIPVDKRVVEIGVEVIATTPWGEEKREERVYSLEAARHLHITLRTAADDIEEEEEEEDEEAEEPTRSTFRTKQLRTVQVIL